MGYRLNTRWIQGLKGEEAQQRRADIVLASGAVLDVLAEILTQEIDRLEAVSSGDYQNAAWPYKEADRHGELRAYRNILKLTQRTNNA